MFYKVRFHGVRVFSNLINPNDIIDNIVTIGRLKENDIIAILKISEIYPKYVLTLSKFGIGYIWSDGIEEI